MRVVTTQNLDSVRNYLNKLKRLIKAVGQDSGQLERLNSLLESTKRLEEAIRHELESTPEEFEKVDKTKVENTKW